MRIHWEHHTPTSKVNPTYRGGGQAVGWRVTQVGGPWEPFDTLPQDSGTLPLIWSEPSDPKVLAPIVEEWLSRETTPGIYDDAVIAYSWQEDKVRVAMARVNLGENEEYPLYPKCFPEELPTWFRTGLLSNGLVLEATTIRLLVGHSQLQAIWMVPHIRTAIGSAPGIYIWPKGDVRKGASGRIRPDYLEGKEGTDFVDAGEGAVKSIRVVETMRDIYRRFTSRTLIVLNDDGTHSPLDIWVGDHLTLAEPGSV